MTLQTKFHELVTLSFDVVGWEVGFCFAVGSGDDLGWGVDSALTSTFIAAFDVVWVDGIVGWVVAFLAIGFVVAI
jgi:hypothetical protein